VHVVGVVLDVRWAWLWMHGADEGGGEAHIVRGFEVAQRVFDEDGACGINVERRAESLIGF
jgi:hypothetical protein